MSEPTSDASGTQQLQSYTMGDADDRSAPATPVKAAATTKPTGPVSGRALRRLIDADIESELNAALGDFEAKTLLDAPAAAPRPAASGRAGDKNERRNVRVIAVRGDFVYTDLGEKSEGVLPIMQFVDALPNPGDLVEVVVDQFDERQSLYVLRRPGAAREADWGSVEKGMIVDAVVKGVNKGGLEVNVNGIRGFMPAGQVDIGHIADLSTLVGHSLRSKVWQVDRAAKNLVVSRRALLEEERAEKAKTTLADLQVGGVYDGVVKKLMDFGAFVDIGGVDGLVHIGQLSWKKVQHPSEVVQPGDKVKVTVLTFDPDTQKIGLGMRQAGDNPWSNYEQKYKPGSTWTGTVSNIMDFGAFVQLEPGVEGLVHISELSHKRAMRVTNFVKLGQTVEVKVVEFDKDRQRIALSMRQAQAAAAQASKEAEEKAKAEAEAAADAAAGDRPKPKGPSKPLKGGLGSTGPLFG